MSEATAHPPQAPKTVALHTLGCRLNSSETAEIAQGFAKRGYEIVELGHPADVVFINTCTVTDGADATCRNVIRKARLASPSGKVVVAGCYAQMESKRIAQTMDVDLILGTAEKYRVFDFLDKEHEEQHLVAIKRSPEFAPAKTSKVDGHTRAFLKIQDGCNYVCSFCIIPFARGRSRAIAISDALSQAKSLVRQGFKEIVLTGVNIGEFESASGEKLCDLVKAIGEQSGIHRLRLSSVEPNTISEDLLKALQQTGIYQPHFHIPLQSGSDSILRLMRRKYDLSFYKEVLAMVKDVFPSASIGADMIAGHPGEGEKEFQEHYDFVENSPLTHFHVFPYSSRKNTRSSLMEGHVPKRVKKERVQKLIELGDRKLASFAAGHVGQEREVLFETRKNGRWMGLTPEYIRVMLDSELDLANEVRAVRLHAAEGPNLIGRV